MKFPLSRGFFFLAAILTLLFLAGCPGNQTAPNTARGDEKVRTGKTFVIAILPKQNIFYQKRRYRPLVEYLSGILDMNVKTKLLDSYEAVYREMSMNNVDAAIFGGLSYVVVNSKIGIDPIVRPVYSNGRSTYRGVIFARRDKGLTGDVSTWKGKSMALVSKSTTSGYLFPRWYLYKKGVNKFDGYLNQVFYVGTHDGTIRTVMDGKVDIGCSTDRIFDRFLIRDPQAKKELKILAASGPFPSDTLGIRKGSLDRRSRELLEHAFLHMGETGAGRNVLSLMKIDRFIKTRKSDYDRIIGMISDLGLSPDFFRLGGIGHGAGRGRRREL